MVTRLAGLNPGCCPIARLLLACPRPRHLLPNGCLFLHTAHGGGASGRYRDAPGREQGRVHAPLSTCVHGPSLTNGGTDQSEWTAAGSYPMRTSPASKGGGSPGTTVGLANGRLLGGFPAPSRWRLWFLRVVWEETAVGVASLVRLHRLPGLFGVTGTPVAAGTDSGSRPFSAPSRRH